MARTEAQKRDAAKDARLKLFFRTSLEEYRAIEEYQKQFFNPVLGTTRRGLDHCHTTGLIRGVLDWRVNRALGIIENAFKENTVYVLRTLARYVENPPAIDVIGKRYGLIGKARRKKKMIYGPPVEKNNGN
jgi:hypothetical protein